MKIMSPKTMFGTLAATGLLAMGAIYCSKKEVTPLEKAQLELQEAREKYTKDSLDFVNSDSIKAKEKLAKLIDLKADYLGFKHVPHSYEGMKKDYDSAVAQGIIKDGCFEEIVECLNQLDRLSKKHKEEDYKFREQSGTLKKDKNTEKMDSAINVAKANINIATGKIFNQTKEKLAKAEALVKAEKIMEKELNNEPITKEEKYFAHKVLNSRILDGMIESQEHLTKMSEILKKIAADEKEEARKDSIMKEFNKVAEE